MDWLCWEGLTLLDQLSVAENGQDQRNSLRKLGTTLNCSATDDDCILDWLTVLIGILTLSDQLSVSERTGEDGTNSLRRTRPTGDCSAIDEWKCIRWIDFDCVDTDFNYIRSI